MYFQGVCELVRCGAEGGVGYVEKCVNTYIPKELNRNN